MNRKRVCTNSVIGTDPVTAGVGTAVIQEIEALVEERGPVLGVVYRGRRMWLGTRVRWRDDAGNATHFALAE